MEFQRFSDILAEKRDDLQFWNLGLQGCTAECMNKIVQKQVPDFSPDLLIIQASGNDLDQTLWKIATSKEIPAMSIQALRLMRSSRLLEEIVYRRSSEQLEHQLHLGYEATKRRYGADIRNILSWAQKNKIPVISLNLPFAYGYHYGKHQHDICAEYPDVCLHNITQDFTLSVEERAQYGTLWEKDYVDFVEASALEFSIPEEELAAIFPFREAFHDVCHLSPLGHAVVASELLKALENF